MSGSRIFCVAAVAMAAAATPTAARAQDASFGCKVLLCALASNPSWQGISYCLPVMSLLFATLRRKGGSWPICGEAKSGTPQHEPYAACPQGSEPVTMVDGRAQPDPNGAKCQGLRQSERQASDTNAGLTARERRAEPWFIELDGPEGRKRFYYSLGQ
jgi:hypothetical protein